jgi:hypothetical protein
VKYINLLAAIALCCSVLSGQEPVPQTEAGSQGLSEETKPDSSEIQTKPDSSEVREAPAPAPEAKSEKPPLKASGRLRILEDKIQSLEVYKVKDLENRIQALEKSEVKDSQDSEKNLTPLATGDISKWGTGQGMGISFGTISHNTSIGVEVAIAKFSLPQFDRPLTHFGLVGFGIGMDWWFNTALLDNEEWGLSPYIKITANSMVFENYLRIYGSVEPVMVYGFAVQGQKQRDLHLGLRGAFGAEFYVSKNYNFFAEVGIIKTESVDGATKDTGLTPLTKAGPRFWF